MEFHVVFHMIIIHCLLTGRTWLNSINICFSKYAKKKPFPRYSSWIFKFMSTSDPSFFRYPFFICSFSSSMLTPLVKKKIVFSLDKPRKFVFQILRQKKIEFVFQNFANFLFFTILKKKKIFFFQNQSEGDQGQLSLNSHIFQLLEIILSNCERGKILRLLIMSFEKI